MKSNFSLRYKDIVLIPNYSECFSRADCDTRVDLLGEKFRLPIIPANMKSVIDMKQSKWMSERNYFYIMHRFGNNLKDVVTQMNEENWQNISVSMGVKLKDKKDIVALAKYKQRVDYITIDIAHGHSSRMKSAIECVKKFMPDTKIIAGNVATSSGVKDLADWGADIVKIGIGQGSPCTTKDKTGFTLPMFTCAKDCSGVYVGDFDKDLNKVPIIADGGVKCNGDIAKALVAGADMVMAGGLFASCTDSPAVSSSVNNIPHKAYFGSASAENKGHNNHIEGKLTNICSNGMTYEQKLEEVRQDLQSSISYSGGTDLSSLPNVNYELCF
jgi:GMP reductase